MAKSVRFRKAGDDNMASEVKWIKICTDIFDDEKILLIESMPDADSIIVVWFKLLCLAGKQNNGGVFIFDGGFPYTNSMLATVFRRKETTVELALNTFEKFGMIQIIEGAITIPNWEKHQNLARLEQVKENTRIRVARHRQRQKEIAEKCSKSCNALQGALRNTDVTQVDIDIERNIEKEYISPAKSNGFEAIWTIYPRKKDKAAARKAYEARLKDGWSPDELLSAVKAYAAECRKERRDEKYIKHGSTFFGASTPFSDYIPKHDAQFVDDLNGVI